MRKRYSVGEKLLCKKATKHLDVGVYYKIDSEWDFDGANDGYYHYNIHHYRLNCGEIESLFHDMKEVRLIKIKEILETQKIKDKR